MGYYGKANVVMDWIAYCECQCLPACEKPLKSHKLQLPSYLKKILLFSIAYCLLSRQDILDMLFTV